MIASGAIAGMVITSGLAAAALIARATAQRQTIIAKREAETARQTTAFLVDLFKISDPSEARGNSLTAREVLDKGATRVEKQLARQPQIQATLMDTLGTVYMGLGLYGQAQPLLQSAVAKRQVLVPSEPTDLALSLRHLGDLQTLRAANTEAENAYQRAISLQNSLPPDKRDNLALACSLYGLGNEQENAGRFAEAEKTLREALTLQQRLYTDASVDCQGSQGHAKADIARTMQVLAWAIRERDLNEAVPLMKSAVAIQRSVWGAEPYPDYAAALNDLGLLLRDKGDYKESEQLLQESLAMNRRLLGDKHREIANSLQNLANVLLAKDDLAGASSNYRQALAMQRELLGNVHPDVALTLQNLAGVIYAQGDVQGAVDMERESLHIYRTLFPGDNPDVARTMTLLGYWLTDAGEYSSAESNLQEGLAMRRRLFGNSHPQVASSLLYVAILQVATHKYADALASAQASADMFSAGLSASNWKTAMAQAAGGAALTGMGRYSEAEEQLVHSYKVLNSDQGALPMYRTLVRGYLEDLYRKWGRPQDARRYAGAKNPPASAPQGGAVVVAASATH
jgi:serine/threonine-protein kinase